MDKLAESLGRVIMGSKLNKECQDPALRSWAEIEYGRDKNYAIQELQSGRFPDLR